MLRGLVRGTSRIAAPQSRTASRLVLPYSRVMPSAAGPARKRMDQVQSHLSRDFSSTSDRSASASNAVQAGSETTSKPRTGGGDGGDEAKVLTRLEGNTTTILLNRPKALNALDAEMIELMEEAIVSTPPHTHILLRGTGRALCSGGDVMAVVTAANSDDPIVRQQALTFFKNEFELDYRIATLGQGKQPRTFVSIMDGITMGGGVGLSVHAPIRVSTEKTMFAMPETGIGYFPDVGVTRCLSRLDGKVGQYLGMTGARLTGEEVYLAGLATHFIPSSQISTAVHRLSTLPPNASPTQISDSLDDYSVDPFNKDSNEKGLQIMEKSCLIGAKRIALDYCFGQPSAEAVYVALQEVSSGSSESQSAKELASLGLKQIDESVSAWAGETIKTLDSKSPRSLKVSLSAINEARRLDISESFRFDMRLATAFCDLSIGRDFYEGVTHTLTKDPNTGKRREGRAKWDPSSLDKVVDSSIRSLFFGPVEQAKKDGLSIDVPTLSRVPASSQDRASQRQRDEALTGLGPLHWEKEHNTLALPSEAECEALREGSHPAAGTYVMTEDELIATLRNVKGDRPALAYKVKDWWQRRQMKT